MTFHELLMKVIVEFTSDQREEIYEYVEDGSRGGCPDTFEEFDDLESKLALDYIVDAYKEGFEIQGERVEKRIYDIIMTGGGYVGNIDKRFD